jgi:hypothetical protein
VKILSKQTLRWIIIGLCALAAIRVFVFAAAFPFFNNVDEQAHVDLVIKYSHAQQPRGIEPFALESALDFTIYSTPEYFLKPEQYGGQYPQPMWMKSQEELRKLMSEEVPFWESRSNYESGEPPLYYAIAGAWLSVGRTCDFGGLSSLYWVRFLNVAFAIALVWLGYKAARIAFPDRQFPAIATATLLAIWPQSSFYSVQGDSLSPVIFGLAFIATAKLLESERPAVLPGVWIGLAIAATCLVKTANLPLLFVVCIAVFFKTVRLAREGALQRGLSILGAFVVCAAVPLGIWFAWNQHHFGDLTATKSKIEQLGWTPKAFADWWSHPIFTLTGAKDFWAELIASFWRGEFIWHRDRMGTWWSDASYWTLSTLVLVIAMASLAARKRTEPNRSILWLAIVSFGSLVGFLILLSIRFDFGQCPYPSRAHPYFTSGRLLNAAAIPFFLLFAYVIERVTIWTNRQWVRWVVLGFIVLLVSAWQLSINTPVLSSQYNFFHRPSLR